MGEKRIDGDIELDCQFRKEGGVTDSYSRREVFGGRWVGLKGTKSSYIGSVTFGSFEGRVVM
jgi:hypothetical protein